MEFDFSQTEVDAIKRVTGWNFEPDDWADMRHAIHDMIEELAKIKDIDISDLDLEDETWC